jgi:WD40 repeat protein/energy-coupling factor transporter ATP-binding protein EcfA2
MPASSPASRPAADTAFDVFLSHNSREKPVVERLARRLRDAGLEPWLDAWCLTQGGRWQDELAGGLRASRACAVFIGPNDAGDWEREEVGVALDWAAKHRGFRVFLVLLPGVAEPFDAGALSPFLSTRTWVDLRGGVESPRAVQALINAIKGVPLDPPPRVEPDDAVCPYRGLQPFDSDHTAFYFGRDREVQRLVEQLKTTRFLAVLGPSGSGKSSLALAGLVPALRRGALPGSEAWSIQILTPGADPLVQLAAQFTRVSGLGGMQETLDRLAADPRTLHLATALSMADRPTAARSVWIVDQFEEVFTLCRDAGARDAFIANLLHAASPEGRCFVVITMRADFYHRCAAHADLAGRISGHQLLVGPMDADGLRQAIEEPARLVGLEFEEGLVETMIDAVRGEPGALPLLEHALLELWTRRRGGMLTLEAYRESGGVQGALARRADLIYDGLDATEQATARRVLLRLTQVGEGSEDTRRRASLSELVTRESEAPVVERVVKAWTDARLFTSASGDGGETWISVAHEALIRAWPRFRRWIDEDRAGQRLHRQMTEAAGEWRRLGRDESLLLRGLRLAQAREFRREHEDALNDLEREFLDASAAQETAEQRQRDRRRRQVVIGLSTGIAVALGLMALAGWQWQRAEREQSAAAARGLVAEADVLRTQALTGAPSWLGRLERGALLAIEGRRLRPSLESAVTLRAAVDGLGRSAQAFSVPEFASAFPGFSAERDEVAFIAKGEQAVRLIDLTTGRTVHTLPAPGEVKVTIYAPGGAYVAVTTETVADIWRLATGASPEKVWSRPIGPLKGAAELFPVAFSPDARRVALIAGNEALVLETATGAVLHRLAHDGAVVQAAFSGDGSRLVAASEDQTASVLNVEARDVVRLRAGQEITGLAVDRKGRQIAFLGAGHAVYVMDVAEQRIVAQANAFSGKEYPILLVFSEDGARLGLRGEYGSAVQMSLDPLRVTWETPYYGDNQKIDALEPRFMAVKSGSGIEVWEASAARPVALVAHKGEMDKAEAVHFSPVTGRLVVLAEDARLWAYDTRPGSEVGRMAFDRDRTPVPSPDRRLLACFDHGAIVLVGPDAGTRTIRLAPPEAIRAASWANDGRRVMTQGENATVRVWDAADGRELWSRAGVDQAAISPDGRLVVATLPDDSIHAWDIGSGHDAWQHKGVPAKTTDTDDDDDEIIVPNVQRVFFLASGDRVAVVQRKGGLRAWRVDGGQELPPADLKGISAVELGGPADARSADGRYFATTRTASDHGVDVTDVSSGRVLATIRHDADPNPDRNFVSDMVFTADGRFLLTAGGDATARIWTLDGREVDRVRHSSGLAAIAVSRDGRRVTTVDAEGLLRTFLWQEQDLITQACGRLTRNLSRGEWRTHLGSRAYAPTCPGLSTPDAEEKR